MSGSFKGTVHSLMISSCTTIGCCQDRKKKNSVVRASSSSPAMLFKKHYIGSIWKISKLSLIKSKLESIRHDRRYHFTYASQSKPVKRELRYDSNEFKLLCFGGGSVNRT